MLVTEFGCWWHISKFGLCKRIEYLVENNWNCHQGPPNCLKSEQQYCRTANCSNSVSRANKTEQIISSEQSKYRTERLRNRLPWWIPAWRPVVQLFKIVRGLVQAAWIFVFQNNRNWTVMFQTGRSKRLKVDGLGKCQSSFLCHHFSSNFQIT